MKPLFQLLDFGVLRNGQPIVSGLNVEFRRGEVTVFMGPSGVGKTSVMQAMLGYAYDGLSTIGERIYHESHLPHGEVLPGHNVYIPQHLPFNPNWEVGSFLCRLPWGNRKWWHEFCPETPSRRRTVEGVLQKLGIGHRLRATVAELSGGEIQRAALAQLLLMRPEIYVADEMTSGLDPGIATWVLDQCRVIVDDSDGCAALATHDVPGSLRIGNQVVLLWPKEVGERPWLLTRDSPYWDTDAMHAVLNLARWAHEYCAVQSIRSLIAELRPESLPKDVGSTLRIVNLHNCVEQKTLNDCSATLREKLESSRCIPIRHSENGRLLIGIAGLAIKRPSRHAILAEVELEGI
jgi:ABC-type Mn2+/Zn2+ transport system ATPase subunit